MDLIEARILVDTARRFRQVCSHNKTVIPCWVPAFKIALEERAHAITKSYPHLTQTRIAAFIDTEGESYIVIDDGNLLPWTY